MTTKQAILVKRLPHGEGVPLPQRMTPDASGCDIVAAVEARDTEKARQLAEAHVLRFNHYMENRAA